MKDAFENNVKKSLENFEMPYNAAAWTSMQSALDVTTPASSSNIEQQFKDSLNGVEYPYNAAAWSALEAKLDAPKGKSYTKWYVAAGILAVASASIFFLTTDTTTSSSTSENAVSPVAENTTVNKQNSQLTSVEVANRNGSEIVTPPTAQNASLPEATDPTSSSIASTNGAGGIHTPNPTDGGISQRTGVSGGNDERRGSDNNTTQTQIQDVPEKEWSYTPVAPPTLCQGASTQILNNNDYPVVIIYPNGLNWTGRQNGVTTLNPSVEGVYRLGYLRNNNFIEKETFTVQAAPKADFEFVDISQKYLNGLPTIEVRTNLPAESYEWQFDNVTAQGPTAAAHFFKKGNHSIALTMTNSAGCSNTIAKTINVEENYNLIAMKGFEPLDLDPRNNTFMPYALKERNTGFKMIVLDPTDGHLVFETTDANEGWDGVDQSNGTMVKFGTAYIWKVTLFNPEPGEKTDYAGTIIPTQR